MSEEIGSVGVRNAIQSAVQSLTNARGYLLEARTADDYRRVVGELRRSAEHVDRARDGSIECLRKIAR